MGGCRSEPTVTVRAFVCNEGRVEEMGEVRLMTALEVTAVDGTRVILTPRAVA